MFLKDSLKAAAFLVLFVFTSNQVHAQSRTTITFNDTGAVNDRYAYQGISFTGAYSGLAPVFGGGVVYPFSFEPGAGDFTVLFSGKTNYFSTKVFSYGSVSLYSSSRQLGFYSYEFGFPNVPIVFEISEVDRITFVGSPAFFGPFTFDTQIPFPGSASPAPELASWIYMILGFGLVGLAFRRGGIPIAGQRLRLQSYRGQQN